MKKLLLLLLCVPLIFSCGESKKINELQKEIEELNDRIEKSEKKDDKHNLDKLLNLSPYQWFYTSEYIGDAKEDIGDLNMDELFEDEIDITIPEPPPPPPPPNLD